MAPNGLPNGLHTPQPSVSEVPKDDSEKVRELEAEIRFLTEKATAAVEKYADYEDEVRRLKAQIPQPANDGTIPRDPLNNRPSASTHSASGSRISNFIHSRKPTPTSSQAPTARESELQVALAREQALRQAAEAKVTEVHNEIEDLSATLFEQANEMVASERKAKAKLENRVHELEQREVDKKRRLEKLEAAMKRIERVKTLLAP